MRAAYFLSSHEHLGRPFDDAIIRGLLEAGFGEVHLYVPGPEVEIQGYPNCVRAYLIDYRLQWLNRHLLRRHWRDYSLFLGACNLPMAFAGTLAIRARRPLVTLCDEIYTGRHSPAVGYWETLAKFAMRRAAYTIITDTRRCALQRSYARLAANHEFIENPCCYARPYEGPTKEQMRQKLNIPAEAFVLVLSGSTHDLSGTPELITLMREKLPGLSFMVQTAGSQNHTTDAFFDLCKMTFPLSYFSQRCSYSEALQITNAADVGFVVYRQDAPQFQNMGVSSQKLCSHLLLGQPVIAFQQPSFQFLEDYRCGILFNSVEEVPQALQRLRDDYDTFSQNAYRCVQEYLRPGQRVRTLAERFQKLS